MFLVPSPPHPLIVVEDGGADGLLCSMLADNIVVYTLLQISGIELRNSEVVLVEHGPTSSITSRIIAACETRVEILCTSWGGSSRGGGGEGTLSAREE